MAYKKRKHYYNLFNITYTYRRDAVISAPYGKFTPKDESRNQNNVLQHNSIPKWKPIPKRLPISVLNRDFSYKNKDILWIVSHCTTDSKREDYVKKLQKELSTLSIDILGECGKDQLPTQHKLKGETLGKFPILIFQCN